MEYVEVQSLAIAILTSIITGGFVLVFVEIGNKKHRDIDRHEQIMRPFMHKLSAYFRFINWSSHRIKYPKPTEGYNKDFKDLISSIGGYGSMAILSGGDYMIGHFSAEKLEDIALKINNVWYYHDKMHPCELTWDDTGFNTDFINKELKEINPIYLGLPLSVGLIAKVSGDFYTDIYQPIEYETYRHEAFVKQYKRNTFFVAGAFLFVLLVLCAMLYFKIPLVLLQILTTIVVLLLVLSIVLLAVDTMTQIKWWNNMTTYIKKIITNDWITSKMASVKIKFMKFFTTIKDYFFSTLVLIGIILSAWAIFSIEIPLIPRIPTCLSEPTIEGMDRLFLALAYSYVAGAILYWFTSVIPYKSKKRLFNNVILTKIDNIGKHIESMHLEFREPDVNPAISEIDSIMDMFSPEKWRKKCKYPTHTNNTVIEAFLVDFKDLKSMISTLINDYKGYLTSDQIILLEKIRDSILESHLTIGINIGSLTDMYFEEVLQPCYKEILTDFNKLLGTLGASHNHHTKE